MATKFIQVQSDKFHKLPGEEDEIVNEGMYGKALGQYLQIELQKRDYEVPLVCCEDWGWWVELKNAPFQFGVCIYCEPDQMQPTEYVCTDGATGGGRVWSWRKFGFVDTSPWIDRLYDDLISIFNDDPAVELVAIHDDFPF